MSNQNEPKNPQAAQQSPPDPLPASRARRWEKPTFTVAFSPSLRLHLQSRP